MHKIREGGMELIVDVPAVGYACQERHISPTGANESGFSRAQVCALKHYPEVRMSSLCVYPYCRK